MVIFEKNKKYDIKLGEADITSGIYRGIKQFNRRNSKHVFLVSTLAYRTYKEPRFYLGDLNKTTFEKGIVRIRKPKSRFLKSLEKKVLTLIIEELKKQ